MHFKSSKSGEKNVCASARVSEKLPRLLQLNLAVNIPDCPLVPGNPGAPGSPRGPSSPLAPGKPIILRMIAIF